tara:strand:+ start:55685 stop:56710 length:1026 start_codon:yes stop_codon:yes gene_type:complete
MNRIFIFTLLGFSLSTLAQEGNRVHADVKSSLKDAIGISQDFDHDQLIEKASEVDLSKYNIDGLRHVMNNEGASEELILQGRKATLSERPGDSSSPQMIAGYAGNQEALDREEILNFMGLSETRNHLYVFVSYSMPEDMIRAYAREALWSGATLIIKGFEEGETFKDFMRDKGLKLINNQGLTASLQIDPKLFESFAVDYVPTIVLSKEDYASFCEPSGIRLHASNVTEKCKERPSDSYVKISGSVTLDYALEQFEQTAGFQVHARERMDALRENIGKPKDNEEQVAEYNFDDTLLPHQKEAIYEEYSKFGTVVETEKGLSVIPFSPPQSVGVHFKRHEGK